MVVEKQGNVLDSEAQVIGHQTNCRGVMGAGLAKQIKAKYPEVFEAYAELCGHYEENPKMLLGSTQILPVKDNEQYIANLFGQDNHDAKSRQTNYEAVYTALEDLKIWMAERKMTTLALPDHLSSGLAGGNWNIVKTIIREIFKDSAITVEIWLYQ